MLAPRVARQRLRDIQDLVARQPPINTLRVAFRCKISSRSRWTFFGQMAGLSSTNQNDVRPTRSASARAPVAEPVSRNPFVTRVSRQTGPDGIRLVSDRAASAQTSPAAVTNAHCRQLSCIPANSWPDVCHSHSVRFSMTPTTNGQRAGSPPPARALARRRWRLASRRAG
jgi:hypothetical protein